jgi:hypothetical protein
VENEEQRKGKRNDPQKVGWWDSSLPNRQAGGQEGRWAGGGGHEPVGRWANQEVGRLVGRLVGKKAGGKGGGKAGGVS